MRQLMRLGLIVAAAGLFVGLTAMPSQAAATNYVALGDSYSSGTGTRDYFDSDCQRSKAAYPELIAAAQGYNLDFQACSGALIGDVQSKQLGTLNADTGLVTLTAGGNDTGWTDVVTKCALPLTDCTDKIDAAEAFIRDEIPGRLNSLYDAIAAKAPNAKVIVADYPHLFMGEDCNAGTFFSPDEEKRMNAAEDKLDDAIGAAAASHGFTFADVRDAFTGHAVCDDTEWLNGLSNPIGESYHPNKDGHAKGYTPVFTSKL